MFSKEISKFHKKEEFWENLLRFDIFEIIQHVDRLINMSIYLKMNIDSIFSVRNNEKIELTQKLIGLIIQ